MVTQERGLQKSYQSLMAKKYIIFSPINQYGGVALEVAFIAKVLKKIDVELKVISLANFYEDSFVYYFDKNLNYNSIDRLLYQENPIYKGLTKLLRILKPINVPNHFRTENDLTKVFGYKKSRLLKIESEIAQTDVVIIASQLTAKFNKEIIEAAYRHKKNIIFRVTGQIHEQHFKSANYTFLNKVSLYIQHSKKNEEFLKDYLPNSKQTIIDQTAFIETNLLNIPIKENSINRFFILSRLDSNKNVRLVVNAFLKLQNNNCTLHIYGDGPEEKSLKSLSKKANNIFFHGKLEYTAIAKAYNENDCLIIPSYMEAGPLTGIEAMAAGKLIISTKVGAMEERLPKNYPYFIDNSSTKELLRKIALISDPAEKKANFNLRKNIRIKYLSKFSNNEIFLKYVKIIYISNKQFYPL